MLKEALEKIGWEKKFSLYNLYFVKTERLTKKVNTELSIIIIAWQYKKEILECLMSLRSQRRRCEIVFVNNGAGEVFNDFKTDIDIYVELNKNTGDGVARNFGAVFATSPILCFLDDDAAVAVNYVNAHIREHRIYDIVGLRGLCKPKTDNVLNKKGRHYDLGRQRYARFSDLEGNSSYKAETFYKILGWDDKIFFGHSGIVLSKKLLEVSEPYQQIYSPKCVIYHDYVKDEEALENKKIKHDEALKCIEKFYGTLNSIRNIWEPFLRDPESVRLKKC